MKYTSGDKNLGNNITQTMIDSIVLAVSVAVEQALFDVGRNEIAKLAKDTGRLRTTIESSLIDQIASQSGQTRIVLTLDKALLSGVTEYIEKHWNRPPYTNPTTPGTIPIYPLAIMEAIKGNVKWQLIRQFKGARFKVTVSA